MDMSYDDRNRAFAQAFMARSSMTFKEGRAVLAAIFSAHDNNSVDPTDIEEQQFVDYIAAANSAISPFDFEIRSTLRQVPKAQDPGTPQSPPERVYALVNTTSDPLTQLATTYTPDQIAFVKRVLDYMFDTNNTRLCEGMVITHMQAANLARPPAGERHRRESGTEDSQSGPVGALTMTEAETMVQRLMSEGWLERSPKDYISLTPRALMELRHWLVSEYNDENFRDRPGRQKIKFCAACKDIMTVGQRCDNRDCPGRLHDHCTENFFRMERAEVCPQCKQAWTGESFVGERAETVPGGSEQVSEEDEDDGELEDEGMEDKEDEEDEEN
ncbi:hypothetical protein N7470_006670 [Penicillium chermesinum]|nr:hypothetical protein N7470_006670 [Penicillium chermesinum]